MSVVRRASRGRLLALAIVGLLAAGLLWGIGSAVAADESASPAAGGRKAILRLGWTNDPDNLNPFIGYESSSYESGPSTTSCSSASRPATTPTCRGSVWPPTGRPRTTTRSGPSPSPTSPSGRTAHRSRPKTSPSRSTMSSTTSSACSSTTSSSSTRSRRPTTRQWCSPAPSPRPTCSACGSRSARSISGARSSRRRSRQVQESAAHHRLGALPDRGVEEGRVRAHGRQQGLLARRPQGRRGHLPDLPEPGAPMAQDLKTDAIQSGWNIPSAQVDALNDEPDLEAISRRRRRCRSARVKLRRQEGLPQVHRAPGAAGPGLPQRSPVGRGQGQDRLHRVQRQRRRPTHSAPPTSTATMPTTISRHRLPTRSTSRRRGRRWTRRAIPTVTATASASIRASRSSCVSTPAPSPPRARTAASSSPAGSRRSAWTSTTR